MVILGFVLMVAVIAIGVGVLRENTATAHLSVFGHSVAPVHTEWELFLAGALVAVVFTVSLLLLGFGTFRAVRRRQDLRDLQEEHEETMSALRLEKQQLQRELARARGGLPDAAPVVPGMRPAPADR